MIALVAPILVFLLFLGLVSTLARGQNGWVLWAKATALLATFRLGVLWFLLLLHWRGALGLWATPLILVLLPEGMLLPRNQVWTPGPALIASVLVTIGSGLWAVAALVVLSLFRRRNKAQGRPPGGEQQVLIPDERCRDHGKVPGLEEGERGSSAGDPGRFDLSRAL